VPNTIVLALAAAVYPTILAGVIVILSQPNPRRLLVGFLLGGMTVSLLAGFVIVYLLRDADSTISVSATQRPIADIVGGLLSLALGRRIMRHGLPGLHRFQRRRQRNEGGQSWTQRVLGRNSIALAVAAGAILNLPGIWYLAALVNIAADPSLASRLLQIVVFNVIMFALVEIPLVVFLVDEERARGLVADFDAWVHRHPDHLAAGIAFAAGGFLLVKGVVELVA
jgi:hypothetical protein